MIQGWEIKKLGDVCDTGAGGTPLKAHKDYYQGGTIPWLMSGEVSQGEVFEAKNFITEKGLKNSSAKLFPKNTVLVAMYGATAGQVGILKFEACTNQAVCGILPNDKTIPEYLFYCFLSKKEELVAQAVGGAQPNISQIKIRNTKIPIPPLPEQQHIVAILDEAFAAITKAKANAEQNLKNSKELFESYLQGVFENKGEGWEEKMLGEIADVEYGYTDKSTEEGDYRYIRITDIDKNGELIIEDKKYIKHSKEAEGFLIQDNDLLMARTGATFAKVLLFNGDEPSVFASYLIRIKFKEKIENSLYWYFTKTKYYWEQANSLQSGAAQPHFNGAAVKQVIFSYPKSTVEQKVLIEKFATLSIETKKLEAIYQQKINDLEELKKSVLQKAFSGELKTENVIAI